MIHAFLVLVILVAPADTIPVPASVPDSVHSSAGPGASGRAPRSMVADSMVLDKSDRQLTLFYRGIQIFRYSVALGSNPVGDKIGRGDGRTPEGLFYIESRNPRSRYHLSLRISYPDAAHRVRAASRGLTAGGDIMIHGLPPAFASIGALHRQQDWTEGCIAVTNDEIEEIWRAVPNGARILIRP